jgi:Tfp pilus assembly protein PilF
MMFGDNPQYVSVLRLLSDVCMLSAEQGKLNQSLAIQVGLETVLTEVSPFRISLAMAMLSNEEYSRAKACVQSVVDADEDNFYAKAVLGFVLQVAEEEGWKEHYQTVLSQSTDPEARKLAQQGLSLT